jgi:hypothetical protein
MLLPDPSLRTLDKGEPTIRATLAITPPNNDWSIIRHNEPEQTTIDRMLAKAAENQTDPDEDSGIRAQKLKRPMNGSSGIPQSLSIIYV